MNPSEALKFTRPLRKHQAENLDRFAFKPEMGLFHEMGTGKTTTCIAWLRAKYNLRKDVTKTLIITPCATLYNWLDEFKINAPERVVQSVLVPYMRTKRIKYKGDERASIIKATDARIITLNPEALDNENVCDALRKWAPTNFVLDESQKFKSHKLVTGSGKERKPSRLASLLYITDAAENRAILTGTPILNSYLDLWAQCRILDRGEMLGLNFFTFREQYFTDKNIGWKGKTNYFPNWQPKPDTEQKLYEAIAAKTSRITKEECLDLPPEVFVRHEVEMHPDQAKAYREMEKEMITEIQNGTCAATNALSKVSRLLQILSGHVPVEYEDSHEKVLTYFKYNYRLDAAKELLQELTPKHKVILWCSFKANYVRVREMLKELNLEWAEIVGGTVDRQEAKDRFQTDPRCRVMLSNPKAGGVGINLTGAAYSIYYSRDYSLGDREQSRARNHRSGCEMHEKITHIDLVARNTLDEAVLEALLRKENIADNILDRLRDYQ